MIEAADDVFLFVEAVPIDRGEADGMVCGVEYAVAVCVERRGDA
jgi:phosphotransacetylase